MVPAAPPASAPQNAARLEWWREARFGMFIHWGPVSLKGTEIGWSRGAQIPIEEYDNLYKHFNPVKFDADRWAAVAKAAGMKYVVLTTKHHDGFCLWDTKQTDHNIMRSPFGRDVVKELSAACRKQGLAFGTYYSVCDWHHPDFPMGSPGGSTRKPHPNLDRYNQYLKNQVAELITSYGPLSTLWFDVPQEFDAHRGQDLIAFVRGLQPDILINDRTGAGGDYQTPEQRVGAFNMIQPWETCMTICQQWAWRPGDRMKSLKECLGILVRTAGGDGNLLLNVGPQPTGEIEPRQVQRLGEIGAWLEKYGQSIYGTRGGPLKPAKHVVSTRTGKTIYLHILSWPAETLRLPAIPAKIVGSSVLTGGTAAVKQTDGAVEISMPATDRREIDTIVVLELDTPAMSITPLTVGSAGRSLTTGKSAKASNVFQHNPDYGPDKAVDDDADTRWATDFGTRQAWLEVDLGQSATFASVCIDECVDFGQRVRAFELQYRSGDAWKTFYKGSTIGPEFTAKFDPIRARHVRLNILDASEGPTIYEFQLFAPATGSRR